MQMDLDATRINPSHEPDFRTILATRLGRRALVRGLVGAAVTTGLGGVASLPAQGVSASEVSTLTFKEIAHALTPDHAVAEGYTARILIRWGDKILPDAPAFDPMRQTAAAQAMQFGYNNDYQAFLPLPRGGASSDHGLLWINHESVQSHMMFPGLDAGTAASAVTGEQVGVEMAAVGGSVVEIVRVNGAWQIVLGAHNRRITANTPMRIAGPAAGDPRMRTTADPTGVAVAGMFANCAGGVTPWGTILTCEENFDVYFMGEAAKSSQAAAYRRLGLTGNARTGWGRFHDRFHVGKEPNEPNRFGWVVEIDPYDPAAMPVKRTALGRFKHEAANTELTPDGRVVVYSGDDQKFEYLYRFVSRDRYDPADRAGAMSLLDNGTLSVARFDADSVTWMPLVFGKGPLTEANGFASQADVVIDARRAADLLKATPMDRPEDVETNPVTGKVYVVLTNNNQRTPEQTDKVNPRAANLYGQIVELAPPMRDGRPDHGAATYGWDMFLLAGDPHNAEHGAIYGGPLSPSGWLACPDNIAFDSRGRMWIASDQGDEQHRLRIGDGLWGCDTQGPGKAVTRRLYRTPTGAELCGPAFTLDDRTLFVAVQHPAADDKDSTCEHPSTRWPDFSASMPPRPSVVVITRDDGNGIGT
jgi:uncharacterized protein